jgi:lysophospholipase L1-like esterase
MYRSYVALGDSFTEGMDDPRPDGTYRGWADLVAEHLAGEVPDFRYANLAIRGRLLGPIIAEQLEPALSMRPELVSLAGGGNDLLRRNIEPAGLLRQLGDAVRRLRDTGATVLVFSGADPTHLWPGGNRLMTRILALHEGVGEIAAQTGALHVDLWSDDGFRDARMWSDDRLHLSPRGHRRAAARVLERLGLTPVTDWHAELGPATAVPWVRARADDVRWVRRHLTPWVQRRLRGVSSGDLITAKRPTLEPVRYDAEG